MKGNNRGSLSFTVLGNSYKFGQFELNCRACFATITFLHVHINP